MAEQEEIQDEVDLAGYQLAKKILQRIIVPLSDFNITTFSQLTAEDMNLEEPQCYNEAKTYEDYLMWNGSIEEEMTSPSKNATWDVVDRPVGKKIIGYNFTRRNLEFVVQN